MTNPSRSFAESLDAQDPLQEMHSKFVDVPEGQVYFLGNSLGRQPLTVKQEIDQVLQDWQQRGVESFFDGAEPWMQVHQQLTPTLATIVGARPEEIVVMNALTVNLHLLMMSFYRPEGKRTKIICEAKAFPSDQYMLETHLLARGLNPAATIIEVAPRAGTALIDHQSIIQTILKHKDEVALVFFGGINYYSGQFFNIAAITETAHAVGAIAGFDLAHAAGNVEMHLHQWNVDFAAWCNYKYLNGGPGAIAAAFIHERYHTDKSLQRFGGWWGYPEATRFLMAKGFEPAPGAEGWQLSTPPIIQLAMLRTSLRVFESAGWQAVLAKAALVKDYAWQLLEHMQQEGLLNLISPANPNERGCQISLEIGSKGREVYQALMSRKFIVDWREPNVIRFAPVPLYNRFTEIWDFANNLRQLLTENSRHE